MRLRSQPLLVSCLHSPCQEGNPIGEELCQEPSHKRDGMQITAGEELGCNVNLGHDDEEGDAQGKRDAQVLARHALETCIGIDDDHRVVWTSPRHCSIESDCKQKTTCDFAKGRLQRVQAVRAGRAHAVVP